MKQRKGAKYMDTEQESIILALYEKTEQEMSSSKEYKEQISKFNILRTTSRTKHTTTN